MKKIFLFISLAVLTASCHVVGVDGDKEVVLVEKPAFFGSGGIDPKPISTGSVWVAPTTSAIEFSIVPTKYEEHFDDMMTDDHTPVDFSCYATITIIKGSTPMLLEKFGVEWYKNSVSQHFRTIIRDKASAKKMFDLTSNRSILDTLQRELLEEMQRYVKIKNLPVTVDEMNIGAVTPPKNVLEETAKTAAQNQSKLTQESRASSETSRRQAEINKAVADKAYMNSMGMNINEYLQLRSLEIQKEQIEVVKEKDNVTIVLGSNPQTTFPLRK